jgi:hypothetical protein
VKQSQMMVDWVRYYPITGTGTSDVPQNSPDNELSTGATLNSLTATGTGETLTGTGDTAGAGGSGSTDADGSGATTVGSAADAATNTVPAQPTPAGLAPPLTTSSSSPVPAPVAGSSVSASTVPTN